MHQAALSGGLIDTIHASERGSSLLSRNKEGVMSLPGYWALALMSAGLARFVHCSAADARAAAAQGSVSHGRCGVPECQSGFCGEEASMHLCS